MKLGANYDEFEKNQWMLGVMDKANKVSIKKPTPVLHKSVKINFKDFSKAIAKGGADALLGRWESLSGDGIDVIASLGLGDDIGGIGWLLVFRSLMQAIKDLVDEDNIGIDRDKLNFEELQNQINSVLEKHSLSFDRKFFDHPDKDPTVGLVQPSFVGWLQSYSVAERTATAIAQRLPTYFAAALNREWGDRPKIYSALKDKLDTPFTRANDRGQAWFRYASWLQKRIDEPMFFEAFSLRQVYVPLRGFYNLTAAATTNDVAPSGRIGASEKLESHVFELQDQLDDWLKKADKDDAIRLISGGPGSGKSSFSKMFSAKVIETTAIRVLFIPLHHFDAGRDLIEAVGKFVELDGFFQENPLVAEQRDGRRLLIVFDGLDELAMQGKAAEKTAQEFVLEVQRKLERLNHLKLCVQVIISGREVVIQANESYFRKEGQVLHVLPYFVDKKECENYIDPLNLLAEDQRQIWWKTFGAAIGENYSGLPVELDQGNLGEITAQPLLNYLVALSLRRGRIEFTKTTNLNTVYADLLKAIYERGWTGYQHSALQGMEEKDFQRMLEEIALAAWHGDGRTTTVKDIENHCTNSNLKTLLGRFQAGLEGDSKAKVTQLLTAFYFRQSGHDQSGDKTFEFTHKSFGEYLTARRIVREVKLINKKLEERNLDPDEGWEEREALHRWTLMCGPTETSTYLAQFIRDEVLLQHANISKDVAEWQNTFTKLVNFVLQHGIPIERFNPRPNFQEEDRLSRNSEEALLVALNAFARATRTISACSSSKASRFGTWLSRLCGQRNRYEGRFLALDCLSFLDLQGCSLNARDLWSANFESSNLNGANLVASDCRHAIFVNASLYNVNFFHTNCDGATFQRANVASANFSGASLMRTDFEFANLRNASFRDIRTIEIDNKDVCLIEVTANLERAKLKGANLTGAKLDGVNLKDANLSGAKLKGASFKQANLSGAKYSKADMNRAVRGGPISE